MTWEMWFVLLLGITMLVGLIFEIARPDLVVFASLVILLITGIITPEDALIGFSNQGMLTVALLFIVAGAIQKSHLFSRSINMLTNNHRSPRNALLKILVPVSSLSAFLNNTPIVATFTPFVRKWCEDHKVPPSKFLIPLSYATIIGGMMTLVGTSTNLIVHGMMIKDGYHGFSFFQLAIVGIPVTIIGLIYLTTIGYKILPSYSLVSGDVTSQSKKYLAELGVSSHFHHIGKTVEEAGLRKLKGLFLIEILRNNEKVTPVKSTTVIHQEDKLIFTGDVSTIAELQGKKGLDLNPNANVPVETLIDKNSRVIEAVVSSHSSLLGKPIKNTNFRSKFDAAVIAVHRHQELIKGKVGNIILKPGDTLLLLAGSDFESRQSHFHDFFVVTPLENPFVSNNELKKGWFTLASFVIMLVLVVFQALTIFKAMAVEVLILLFFKIITVQEAKNSIHFDVLLLIASAFGIGVAITKTGLANYIANGLVTFTQPFGVVAVLVVIYFLTNIFTEMITNNAAAVIMYPIAMAVGSQIGVHPMGMAMVVVIAASASFLTPIGYQTNMIVYGPGGYRFTDYFKVGFPLSLIVMVITVTIVSLVWV
ncbi:SLC13 family permease [Lentibacillus sediminis]|uniref:SLC13 family permease n=1 Tax=Lentibacillus sediminis TaxID=1940529 RepID=UPI000C1C3C59|nr:SLC13 family permease [Lentibacillus sediminis]